ncbi:Histone acetyltransferase p300 [Lemmus lemmus]
MGLGLNDESNNQQAAATQSPGDSRRLSIQHCIQSLVHACQCRNANCSLPSCQKMKRRCSTPKAVNEKPMVDAPSANSLLPSAATMPSTARRTNVRCHSASTSSKSSECHRIVKLCICKEETNGGCLCWHHAKHCLENKCPVLFCLNIKQKIPMPQVQHHVQQAQLLRRRMASMQQPGLAG